MRTGQRLLLFYLERQKTDRQIHVHLLLQSLRMVGNTVCYHILEDNLVIKTFYHTGNKYIYEPAESYISYFPFPNSSLTFLRISLCAALGVLIPFQFAFLFISSLPVEKIHQNSLVASVVKLGNQLPSVCQI